MKTLAFLAAAAALAVPAASAGIAETIRLAPTGGSGVSGTATVSSPGDRAAAAVWVKIRGLEPGASVRILLNAVNGTSVVRILSARAGKTGTVAASGRIRYRGEPVTFASIADGAHAVSVVAGGRLVARGVIPGID
jgi:hypothetical protein